MKKSIACATFMVLVSGAVAQASNAITGFVPVDTMQYACYETNQMAIADPSFGEDYAGQDAHYAGITASYMLSEDGLTVYDNNTGLTWMRAADTDNDGDLDAADQLTYDEQYAYADCRNAEIFGGFSDWRVPSVKELYSLMDFRGIDPGNDASVVSSGLVPFIDCDYFDFPCGDSDALYGTTALYVDSENAGDLLFSVNFATGRMEGIGLTEDGRDRMFFTLLCRGNEAYGVNDFSVYSSNIVADSATGLMWERSDSIVGLNWEEALAYAENLDVDGCSDWRLPNAKELQGIVDYTRSPGTTDSAAIDPIFDCTSITNEAGQVDYPFYWTGTTLLNQENALFAVDVAFGRAMGYSSENGWADIHGAGSQRSDPKLGELGNYVGVEGGFYNADTCEGDTVRIYNRVRCVRGGVAVPEDEELNDWYQFGSVSDAKAPS